MKVSIIGCGNIGKELSHYIDRNSDFELTSITDINPLSLASMSASLINNYPHPASIKESILSSDLIIECASQDAVREILQNIELLDLYEKKLLIMSSGGIIGNIERINSLKNCEIYVPSGAIAGLDAVKAVSGCINSLVLKTTKTLSALRDAPHVVRNKINFDELRERKIIFEGSLTDAVSSFPQTINVAANLYLASRFEGIKIIIIADPLTKVNSHEIICKGNFGTIFAKTENVPSQNPKTSYLAVLSALSVLKNFSSKIKIGEYI